MLQSITVADIQAAEKAAKLDDPTDALKLVEDYMDQVKSLEPGSGDELSVYFVETGMPSIVLSLLNRSDLDEDRVFHFLEMVLTFLAKHMNSPFDHLPSLVDEIFSEGSHAFYNSTSCFAPCDDLLNPCDELLDEDASSDDNFEVDSESAIFAEANQMDSFRGGVTGWMVSLINVFGRNGGFRAIRDELMQGDRPFSRTRALLLPIYEVREFLTAEFLNWFVAIYEPISQRVLETTDDDLKSDFRNVSDTVCYLCALLHNSTLDDAGEKMDTLRLAFALKGFRSKFLERRLAGLTDMCNLIEEMVVAGHKQVTKGDPDDRPWVTPEYMCAWLEDNDVLASIFTRNLHVEVLKRSQRILYFLAVQGRIGSKEAAMIWAASQGKHESIQQVVLEIMEQNVQHQQPNLLLTLLGFIEALNPADYTIHHCILVRYIAHNLCIRGGGCGERQLAGVRLLWRLIQDESRFSSLDMHLRCTQHMIETVEVNFPAQREYLASECVRNIREHRSVPQTLLVLHRIIMRSPRGADRRLEVDWSTMGGLGGVQDLIALVIDDAVLCQQKARAALGALGGAEAPQLDTYVLEGHYYNYNISIERRLMFLSCIFEIPGASLTEEQVDVVWRAFVEGAMTEKQRDYAYFWFEAIVANASLRGAVMGLYVHVFTNLLCKADVAALGHQGFSMFQAYMKAVNFPQDPAAQRPPELLGVRELWRVAVHAESEAVATLAITFLNQVYAHLAQEDGRVVERREEYISNCMGHLLLAAEGAGEGGAERPEGAVPDERRVARCIRLLKTFLNETEAAMRQSDTGFDAVKLGLLLRGDPVQIRVQRVGGTRPTVTVYTNSTMHQLRTEMGKALGEDPRHLRLVFRGGELGSKDDARTISEMRFTSGDVVHVTVRTLPATPEAPAHPPPQQSVQVEALPHYILSRDHFHQLFALLDRPSGVAQQVWDLLSVLPTNKRLMDEVRGMSEAWVEGLGAGQSAYALWYSLQIVDLLLEERGDDPMGGGAEGGGGWRDKFVGVGGARLKSIVMSERFSAADSLPACACLALLLKVILCIITRGGGGGGMLQALCRDEEELGAFVHRLMHIFQSAALAVGGGQGGGLPDPLDTYRQSVAHNAMRLLETCAGVHDDAARVFTHVYSFPKVDAWVADVLLRCRSESVRAEAARGLLTMALPSPRTCHLPFELGRAHALNAERAAKRRRTSDDEMVEEGGGGGGLQHPLSFLLDVLLPLVREIQAAERPPPFPGGGKGGVSDVFRLVSALLDKIPSAAPAPEAASPAVGGGGDGAYGHVLDDTARALVRELRARPVYEDRLEEDGVLLGALVTVRALLSLRPALAAEFAAPGGGAGGSLVHFLYHDCLFDVPAVESRAADGPPKCKTGGTRRAAFELLLELVSRSEEGYSQLLAALLEMHSTQETRQLHFYQPSQFEKAPCGFVGLRNLGATCYMNSLLQQLYHIPEFRASILQVPADEGREDHGLMYELQSLFAYLQESEKQFYETRDLCQAYKDYDGRPLNTSQQMDVDEYFNILFEKLEKGIQGTPQERLLQECFGGKVVNQIICKEAVTVGDHVYGESEPFKSQREETFYTLQLEVKHKRNILESLDLFVEGETLDGDNKYFCEEANKKVVALKRLCISKLPKSLILHLKRFEFDLDFMKKAKVNDMCEFPTILDMDPYTLDGIERRERAAADAARAGLDPAKAVQAVPSAPGSSYELVGVLVHTGTADYGHYYSYIKDRGGWQDEGERRAPPDGRWYCFNDMVVEGFDDREIGHMCYGGTDYYMQSKDGSQRHECVPRMYNAYMLFYERVGPRGRDSRVRAPVPEPILQRVWAENIQFLKDKHVYDQAYFAFMLSAANLAAGRDAATQDRCLEVSVRFTMDVLVHSWDTAHVGAWVALIQGLLTDDVEGLQRCKWLLGMFTADAEAAGGGVITSHWLRWALLHCRVKDVREQVAGLLLHALRLLSPAERAALPHAPPACVPHCSPALPTTPGHAPNVSKAHAAKYADCPLLTDAPFPRAYPGGSDPMLPPPHDYLPFPRAATSVGVFLDKVLDLLPDAPQHWRHFEQYFCVLREAARIGPAERAFLLSRRCIARCVDIFLHDESPFADHHRYKGRLGDKFAQCTLEPMVELLADLVCSAALPTDLAAAAGVGWGRGVSPWQMEVVGPIDDACLSLVAHAKFVSKLFAEEPKCGATRRLVLHLCVNDSARSNVAIRAVGEALEEVGDDELLPLFEACVGLCAIVDPLQDARVQTLVHAVVGAALENTGYPDQFKKILSVLCKAVSAQPRVRATVVRDILRGGGGGRGDWFLPLLTNAEFEIVRVAAQRLAETAMLCFGGGGGGGGEAPQADEVAGALLEHLVGQLEALLPLGDAVNSRGYACRLVSYFQCLTSAVNHHARARPFEALVARSLPHLLSAFACINARKHDTDLNKAELVRLLLACVWAYPQAAAALTDAHVDALLANHVCVEAGGKLVAQYNALALSNYYRLLLGVCAQRAPLTRKLMQHPALLTAIEAFVMHSHQYPDVALALLEIVELCKAQPLCRDEASVFRAHLLAMLLSDGTLAVAPGASIPLLARLADGSSSQDTAMVVASQEAINTLLAIVGAPVEAAPAGIHQAEATRTLAVEVLQRVLTAAVSSEAFADAREAVGAAPAQDRRNGVTILYGRLFHAWHTEVRTRCLLLLKALALLDDACCAQLVALAQTGYAAASLAPAERGGDVLWAGFRGKRGQGTSDEAFFDVMALVCTEGLSATEGGGDAGAQARAARLVMSCALDALTGPRGTAGRLAGVATSVVREGGGEGWREVFGRDEYSIEWLRRVLLSFRTHLFDEAVSECAGVLAQAVSEGGDEGVRALVGTCEAAVASVREDARALRAGAGAAESGVATAEAALPLVLVLQALSAAPRLRAAVHAADPDGECVRLVGEALEAAGARGEGEAGALCGRIDGALKRHAEALAADE